MSNLDRVTVNLTPRASSAMHTAMEISGDSKTDVLNAAVKVYAYLQQIQADGGTVLVAERVGGKPMPLRIFV